MIAILEDLVRKNFSGSIDFIWSTRSSSEIDCFRGLFATCEKFPKFNVQVFFTGKVDAENAAVPTSSQGFTLSQGRPDLVAMVHVQEKEVCGMLCCGPEALMLQVESMAVDGQRNGRQILFHRETFEF